MKNEKTIALPVNILLNLRISNSEKIIYTTILYLKQNNKKINRENIIKYSGCTQPTVTKGLENLEFFNLIKINYTKNQRYPGHRIIEILT